MSGRCVSRFKHEDGTGVCSLSASAYKADSDHQYLCLGAESGVSSVFSRDFQSLSSPEVRQAASLSSQTLKPLKSLMNLTLPIKCTAFHPSSQILAIASDQAKDQLKLVHLPTCSVCSNWPTERSPIARVKCLEFSPGGAYLAIGNNRGRVLLYRLNDFTSV